MERAALRSDRRWLFSCRVLLALMFAFAMVTAERLAAAAEVEFAGTVITADPETGKMAIKKESGGTRFTFVTNDQTRWEKGLKGIGDLKKDAHVVVVYEVKGSQYIALRVAPKK